MSQIAPDLSAEFPALRRRVVSRIYVTAIPSAMVAAYVFSLIIGLDGADLAKVMLGLLLPILVVSATQQFMVSSALVRRALAAVPGEEAEARLVRLLELPRRVEVFSNVLAWFLGSILFGLLLVVFHGKSLAVGLAAAAVGLFASLFPGLMLALLIEDDVRPVALAEFRRVPRARLPSGGFFWPRQRWYLPYAFAVALVSLVVFSGMVLTAKAEAVVGSVAAALERAGHGEVAPLVREQLSRAISEVGVPLAGIAGVLLVAFLITGLLLARRQSRAAAAVDASLRAMAAGAPEPPSWVATDETGDLAAAVAMVSEQMKHVFAQLRAMAAGELGRELEGDSGLIHAFRESRLAMLELAERMAALARGEPAAGSRVAGDLGAAFGRLEGSFTAIVDQARTIAGGDLRRDADIPGALGAAIRQMTANLRAIIGQTQGVSTHIGDIVVSLQSAATQLSTATTEQVAAVTETANTVTEMAQTSAVSADRAAELIRQGESAAGVVEEGGEAAGAAAHAMLAITGSFEKVAAASTALGERVQRIDSITETVGFLADQSSTLAINAAIEAARAGESGKGFAVVAREIRTLAADSRKAASQIRDLLQEIRERTRQVDSSVSAGTQTLDDGGRLVQRLGDIVGQLGVTVNDAVGLMRQIEGSARQHQAGVGQVSQALTNMQKASESIRDGARLLGELSGKAHQLSSALQKASGAYALPEARA